MIAAKDKATHQDEMAYRPEREKQRTIRSIAILANAHRARVLDHNVRELAHATRTRSGMPLAADAAPFIPVFGLGASYGYNRNA